MVRLTVTPAMLDALLYCREHGLELSVQDELESRDAKLGDPISHGQVIAISTLLREYSQTLRDSNIPVPNLRALLQGSMVYIEPSKPKPEPTIEYKQLMARLREEEEERQYERMINPPAPMETFSQRFPHTNHHQLFPPMSKQEEDEEVTFADINRQVTLIFNILISIVACAVAIWMATRYWPTPQRLGVSMGGGGLVGVAEVVVYAGYLRRIGEAKQKEKSKVEKKQIIDTWVIEPKLGQGVSNKPEKIIPLKVSEASVRQRLVGKI